MKRLTCDNMLLGTVQHYVVATTLQMVTVLLPGSKVPTSCMSSELSLRTSGAANGREAGLIKTAIQSQGRAATPQ